MLDAFCSTHSLSVLLSAVEMTCTTQIALALAWWPLSEIISTRVRVPCIPVLAMATIPGRYLFCSELPTVWVLFKSGDYSKKYSIYLGIVDSYFYKARFHKWFSNHTNYVVHKSTYTHALHIHIDTHIHIVYTCIP